MELCRSAMQESRGRSVRVFGCRNASGHSLEGDVGVTFFAGCCMGFANRVCLGFEIGWGISVKFFC